MSHRFPSHDDRQQDAVRELLTSAKLMMSSDRASRNRHDGAEEAAKKVTMVTGLDWGAASTEEKFRDLQHQLEVYINDIVIQDARPSWLVKQMIKTGERGGFAPSDLAKEFLLWLTDHTWASIEIAEPGNEPLDDIPMAKVADVLIARLAGDAAAELALLQQLSDLEIFHGSVALGVVIALHKDQMWTRFGPE